MKKFLTKLKDKMNAIGSSSEDLEEEDGYVELNGETEQVHNKVIIRQYILKEFEDIKGILEGLRKGDTICLIDIKPLKEKDLLELKRAINKLKKTCDAIEGEVAGLSEEWIVAAPSFATIHRSKQISHDINPEDTL
jgi:SepF-like predicted cell division protein (DUF552 family)